MKEIFINLEKCLGCKNCELLCAVEHSSTKVLFAAIAEVPMPRRRLYVEHAEGQKVPLLCRHCEEAPCVDACVSGALSQDTKTRIVSHKAERCVGCWMCLMVCPYGVIGREKQRKVALKCDQCPDQEVPVCVTSCPTRALVYSEAEEFAKSKRQKAASVIARRG